MSIDACGDYVRAGTLAQYEEALVLETRKLSFFDKGLIYCAKAFIVHLECIQEVDYLDDITSAVDRCVEYGLQEQLQSILDNLDRLLSMAIYRDGIKIFDHRLLLRTVNSSCYMLAQQYGFMDVELEKRIVLIQRIWRQSKGKKQYLARIEYTGPTPEDDLTQDSV